jgi:hypothetical protein
MSHNAKQVDEKNPIRIFNLSVDSSVPTPYIGGGDHFISIISVHLECDDPELTEDLLKFLQPVVIKWASLKSTNEPSQST